MRFTVLGGVGVWDGDRQVELGPARRVTVLAALLVDVGRPVTVDGLVDRVWGGHAPESAVPTLRAHVSRLRSALQHGVSLRTTPSGYALDVDAESVDAGRFTSAIATAERLAAGGDVRAARDEVAAALALWRGRPYADVAAEFVTAERARLEDLHLGAVELAAELDLALGRHATGAAELGPVVAEHPFRERLRAAWMLALYRSGRQVEALQVFDTGRALLADELGIDPGERLRQLHQAMLRHDPALTGPAAPATSVAPVAPGPPAAPAPPDHASISVSTDALIGRDSELDRLLNACHAAASGDPRVVVVVGEAGIGKSRLVEEILERMREGWAVAWGRCWQHEGSPALWPWVQILRELAERCPSEALARALDGRGAVLASLVPELAPGRGPASEREDPAPGEGMERTEVPVFDAVLHALGTLGAHTPVVAIVDDAQWADPWSRRLLEYAASNLRRERVIVVATVRSPLEHADTDRSLLGALARAARTERIDLAGLGPEAVRRLVAARVGRELDTASAAALHARTDGNPFYIGEIARLVTAEREAGRRSDGLPDSVRGVIQGRYAQLPSSDLEVLTAAAVIGRSFDTDLLLDVGDVLEDIVDGAVDRASAAGLLRPEPGPGRVHRFSHALLRETLLEEVGPSRRRRLHRRVAGALETRGGGTVELIAHHRLQAGSENDVRHAVELLLAAADEAIGRWSLPEVESLLHAAGDAAGHLTDPADPALVTVTVRRQALGLLLRGTSLPERAALLETAPRTHLPGRDILALLHGEWGRFYGECRLSQCERVAVTMRDLAEQRDDDLLRLGAATVTGYNQLQFGHFADAARTWAEVERLVPVVTVPPLVFTPDPGVAGPGWAAMSLLVLGRTDDAEAALARARRQAHTLADPIADGFLAVLELYWWVWRDRPDQALAAGEVAVGAVHRVGLIFLEMLMAVPFAWALSHIDLDRGLAASRAAMAAVENPDAMPWRCFLRGVHADVLRRAGEPVQALEQIDAALTESARTGARLWDVELHRARAVVLDVLGADPAEIHGASTRAHDVARDQQARLFLSRLPARHRC